MNGQPRLITECEANQAILSPGGRIEPCPLWPYRRGHGLEKFTQAEVLPILKAIRAHCLDCAPDFAFHGECEQEQCPLYSFRMGNNPKRAGLGNKQAVPPHRTELTARFEQQKDQRVLV
jgi:MoaA/NifB/PqqE/SkfB family radical SAM enzyme